MAHQPANLAVQLTAPGIAALAVVRLAGPAAGEFVRAHFDRPAEPGRCIYGRWREADGQVLDDGLVVAGDGWFDVNLHGGQRIVARLLEQARDAGFTLATGRPAIEAAAADDLEAWLPLASTETGLRLLLDQPRRWRQLDPEWADLGAILADRTLFRLLNPATVALVGAPNVGKSTLANRLFGQERSIVADLPGTTRDWVGGTADLAGLPVVLLDTPGRRESGDDIEQQALALSQAPVASADVVVLVLDATQPDAVPAPPPASAPASGSSTGSYDDDLMVANKCDLALPPAGCLAISAATGEGVDALVEAIHQRLAVNFRGGGAMWWTRRQERLLRRFGRRGLRALAGRISGS